MINIAFIADSWGSQYGGISTLNYELCNSLTSIPGVNVACILPYVDHALAIDTKVKLIGLYSDPAAKSFTEHWEKALVEQLKKNFVPMENLHFCIGHDVITGAFALSLKSKFNLKTIIISHQAYQLYTASKQNDGQAANDKTVQQLKIYQQADLLLCVGPLLYSHFSKKHQLSSLRSQSKIIELIPGLPDLEPSAAVKSDNFSLLTMGRFTPNESDLKGVKLLLQSYATAFKEARQIFGDNSYVTLFGLSQDNRIYTQQSLDVIGIVENLSETYIPVNASPYISDRETLLNFVRDSSCLAMLSLHEGFGLVGWEAIACEIPILISQNSGLYRLLERLGLENLVTSVLLDRNDSDIVKVKEKLKDIANNWDNAKIDAVELHKQLKAQYNWKKVALDLYDVFEVAFQQDKSITAGIKSISIASAENSLKAVENFYDAIKNKNISLAWKYLSDDFKNRGIWKTFKDFKKGYSNFQGLTNLRIFESISGVSEVEYHVIYDDEREVPIEQIVDEDIRFYTLAQKERFIDDLNNLEKRLKELGVDDKDVNNLNIAQFFHPGIQDYLLFKLDLYNKFPRPQCKTASIPRYYRCICVYEKSSWKIDRILPIRYTARK